MNCISEDKKNQRQHNRENKNHHIKSGTDPAEKVISCFFQPVDGVESVRDGQNPLPQAQTAAITLIDITVVDFT